MDVPSFDNMFMFNMKLFKGMFGIVPILCLLLWRDPIVQRLIHYPCKTCLAPSYHFELLRVDHAEFVW